MAGLNSPRWAAMISSAESVLADPTSTQRAQALHVQTLRDPIDAHVAHRVRPRVAVAEGDPADLHLWHEVRKAVKSARYAWEMVAAVPEADDADRAEAQKWQAAASAFGALQDTAVMTDAVVAYLASLPTDSPTVPVLIDLQRRLPSRADEQLATARRLLAEALSSRPIS